MQRHFRAERIRATILIITIISIATIGYAGNSTISAAVRGVDYQDAAMGNYRDTVAISIEP
jgi:hypothetical protein